MSNKFKFTKTALDALKPDPDGKKTLIFWDTDLPGFGARMSPKGRGVLFYQFKVAGNSHKVTMAALSEIASTGDIEDERDRARDTKRQTKDTGLNPRQQQKAKIAAVQAAEAEAQKEAAEQVTLGDFFKETYRAENRGKKTLPIDEAQFDNHVRPVFGNTPLRDVTRQDVLTLRDQLSDAGKPAMANRVLKLLRTVFRIAIDHDVITKNPALGVKYDPDGNVERERFLEPNYELPAFIAALDEHAADLKGLTPRARAIRLDACDAIRLLLLTGARKMEVIDLPWREIVGLDGPAPKWRKPKERTKSGKAHEVHLSQKAADVLRGARERNGDGERVLPGLRRYAVQKAFDEVKENALLKVWALDPPANAEAEPEVGWFQDVVIHDLRHTLATYLASKQLVPLHTIGGMLGHSAASRARITARYAHHYGDELRAAAEAAAGILELDAD